MAFQFRSQSSKLKVGGLYSRQGFFSIYFFPFPYTLFSFLFRFDHKIPPLYIANTLSKLKRIVSVGGRPEKKAHGAGFSLVDK